MKLNKFTQQVPGVQNQTRHILIDPNKIVCLIDNQEGTHIYLNGISTPFIVQETLTEVLETIQA